ncbi:MAG: lactonase family protein [Acidobacteriota bacterium]|nr:lactonase family protein [Acidobacteriota bacterium]
MKQFSVLAIIGLTLSGCAFADNMAWDAVGNNQFGKLDLSTGNFSPISNFGFTAAGLGQIGDVLYTAIEGGNTLYAVNTNTGALSTVGNASLTYFAFGSTNSGLYMVDTVGGLWKIDPTSGASTLIGSTHLLTGSNVVGISSGSDVLYLSVGADVYTINTKTGASTLIGNTGATDFGALVSENGTLYGTSVVLTNSVYSFNPSLGTASLITNSNAPDYAYGLAPTVPAPTVPEPSTFAQFGVVGALLGGYALKRKRA